MPNEPSTPAKGGTREFWKKHSVSPDTTAMKKRMQQDKAEIKEANRVMNDPKEGPSMKKHAKGEAADASKRYEARSDSLKQARKRAKK